MFRVKQVNGLRHFNNLHTIDNGIVIDGAIALRDALRHYNNLYTLHIR